MKNYLLGLITSMAIFAFFGFDHRSTLKDSTNKEWVVAPRFLTLQKGITKEEAKEWLENEYLLLYREFPGFNAMVGEPIKSGGWGTINNQAKEKGDFVLIYFFDSKQTKDHYFPESGWSDDIANGIKKHQATFDKLFGKYFIQDKYLMEEYLMFASSK
jgi:hypothetical protein